jgi:hypothetical protein
MPLLHRIILLLTLVTLLAGAWLAPLDARGTQQVDAGLKRALASFAAARALNAVISVAQGTEVAIEPGGVGVVLAPGQLLDPINDLVEQFSTLMLAASISFGLQRVLIVIGSYWGVSALLTVVALAWAWQRWRRPAPQQWLSRLLVGLVLVRFAVPLAAIASGAGFEVFLADQYTAGQSTISVSTAQIAHISTPPPEAQTEGGVGERLQRWWSNTSQSLDVGKRFEDLKQAAERTVDHMITLIVVFLLQTLVLPLIFLWGLLRIGRALVSPRGLS